MDNEIEVKCSYLLFLLTGYLQAIENELEKNWALRVAFFQLPYWHLD
jgi:hypothetical protein